MTHRMNFHDKFIVFSLRPGEGLKAKGKSRVRGRGAAPEAPAARGRGAESS